MEIAYLGLFQKVFNWVLKKIFDPIFKWLSSLLTTVFAWIFDNVLSDTLIKVLEEVLSWAFGILKSIFGGLIYGMFSKILKLIDYMETAFDVFIGIQPVTYKDAATNKTITKSLLEILFQQKTINTIFWLLTMSGLTLAMIFTVYGTAKSAIDLDFENKRPVSKVLTSMFKAFIQFFSVPFLSYFMIRLSAIILSSVSELLNGSGNTGVKTSLGRIVFMITSLNAALPIKVNGVDTEYNLSKGEFGFTLGISEKDIVRYPFYAMNAKTPRDYGSVSTVRKYFDLAEFDYIIGFIAAIFLFLILAVCLLTFVQRIFDLILLYIVSPYFVSTIPLDDGEKFGKWREMFIGKCFTGFGSAIGMRLYLMVCPMIMGGTLSFGDQNSPEMNYLIKLFFLAGGAWAVYKSGPMLTQLLSFQAAQSESMTQAAAAGAIYSTANRTVAMGSKIYHKHQEKKQKEKEQAERQFNQMMKSSGASGMNGQNGYFAAAEGGGKWSTLARLYASRSQKGRDGRDGRDAQGKGHSQLYGSQGRSGSIGAGRLQNNDLRMKSGGYTGMSGRRASESAMQPSRTAAETSNRWSAGGSASPILAMKSSIQKNLVINEQRTIRTEVVSVRRTEERAALQYSKYSQIAHAASKPGTGGYRA